jgi:hypothetical protein
VEERPLQGRVSLPPTLAFRPSGATGPEAQIPLIHDAALKAPLFHVAAPLIATGRPIAKTDDPQIIYVWDAGYARCRTVGVPRTRLCTRSVTSLSARVRRSCWRKCSAQESTRNSSMKRLGLSRSRKIPH